MKIGILTFHRAINYGAFLQAFALKCHLSENGHTVSIIDYWPNEHANAYNLFNRSSFLYLPLVSKIKYLCYFILRYSRAKVRKNKMEQLITSELSIDKTPLYKSSNDLKLIKNYDLLVYGSDQIWWKSKIKGCEGFDWSYWGDYVPKSIRKIAYAASMGVINLSSEDESNIKSHLVNFDKIAVRESGLKNALSTLTDKDIDVVIDPVFLLDKDTWRKKTKPHKHPNRYVLLFNLMHSEDAVQVAKIKSKELKCEIVEITSLVKALSFGKNVLQTIDAFEFIYLIDHAEFVVTSSFHGTAFSIIFEKQFYSLGMKNNSGRVQSLLTNLGIEERLIQGISDISQNRIDFNKVAIKKDKYIEFSKEYIKSAVSL